MSSPHNSQSSLSVVSVLICIIGTGAIALLLSVVLSSFNWPAIYLHFITIGISVPVGMLAMFTWQKGRKNVHRYDFLISVMGGIGAAVGLAVLQFFG